MTFVSNFMLISSLSDEVRLFIFTWKTEFFGSFEINGVSVFLKNQPEVSQSELNGEKMSKHLDER